MATGSSAGAGEAAAQEFRSAHDRIRAAVSEVIVGQKRVVEAALTALLAGGHVLLEGVPGLGKTMLVRTLGEVLNVAYSRIQFTPDLMPADIQGTQILVDTEAGGHRMEFQQGPLVAQLLLADEINRATPKTQSALLEAMQERQISIGRRTIVLEEPFCVMATQNPVEQEGTYPLPEAQLDRFLFKILVEYPAVDEYKEIIARTTGREEPQPAPVSSGEEIVRMRDIARSVPVPEHVQEYAIRLVVGTQPGSDLACGMVRERVTLGASPRGVQGLVLAGKVRALLAGRFAVNCDDIRAAVPDVLRHRVFINFHGLSDGVTPDEVLAAVVDHVRPPHEAE